MEIRKTQHHINVPQQYFFWSKNEEKTEIQKYLRHKSKTTVPVKALPVLWSLNFSKLGKDQ